ncbi:hypothetical protein, unlikely [Trypanosoma brucei gambiense DAL972]|uniref:Uncharacterized protein n=1 Tax=Trypanosoma brucei gambiense (strain MHOM/CI/86/DAL972) TaxID=679716 RepID=D0A2P9_TRYB9|nr:hypothetical protein, unlikely [Trypanosoma brucei gambiense DAL972]CBH15543.1 hypothetical protein, unlikely [Trypanosoma brucei gambiense DAL972]|eukprot:XP_011777807.1 hypothetical protein, unlikely [Trypanosoma brucei gambiense DAL972]
MFGEGIFQWWVPKEPKEKKKRKRGTILPFPAAGGVFFSIVIYLHFCSLICHSFACTHLRVSLSRCTVKQAERDSELRRGFCVVYSFLDPSSSSSEGFCLFVFNVLHGMWIPVADVATCFPSTSSLILSPPRPCVSL